MATTAQEPGLLVPEGEFARTYSSRTYDDPAEAVRDYRAVTEFAAAFPDAGASAIARMTQLPIGRVRPWLKESRPNPVRGIEAAESHGWIEIDPASDTARGLNALVAWISSSGSIATDTWTPYFAAADEGDQEVLTAAASLAGIELDFTRRAADDRTQEMRPVEHGSVLGRVLVVLGAPRGADEKTARARLPAYLNHVSDRLGREFLQVLLHNRGRTPRIHTYLTFEDARPSAYLHAVVKLVERLTGRPAEVSGRQVVLSEAAMREIVVWEPLLGAE